MPIFILLASKKELRQLIVAFGASESQIAQKRFTIPLQISP
jgi:hypothetical protein